MEWTKEIPTQPGYYWLQYYDDGLGGYELTFVALYILKKDGTAVYFMLGSDEECVAEEDAVDGKWFGPIEPPGES